MELRNARVTVVGLGKTGEALCRFLLGRGARVTVVDRQQESSLGRKPSLWRARGVDVKAGQPNLAGLLEADLILPSPGVPPSQELDEARAKGVPVLSEIELASRFLRGTIVGITGSNGKSTTASLAHKILKDAGLRAFLAGNIGTPLISFAERSRPGHIFVTEISSFQLHFADRFKAAVSVFLNISLNHLDWHGTFESYYEAKAKLLRNQDAEGVSVLNRDDPKVWALRREGPFTAYGFSRRAALARGAFVRDGRIMIADRGTRELMCVSAIPLFGAHNQENVMAAALVGHRFGVSPASMRRSVKTFRGLEHRLEKVLAFRGVKFVNDSKATTVDSTIKALESFDRPVVLILGGKDKGADFTLLRKPARGLVRKALLIGQARDKIRRALEGHVPLEDAGSLREAVRRGFESAGRGSVVLLAPACASFDMFKDFEDRGRSFKREVARLARKVKG